MFGWTEVLDAVANADGAAGYHIRIQPTPIGEPAQDARLGQLLQVVAGMAELRHNRLDLADADPVPEQPVQRHTTRHHVATALARLQLDAGVGCQPLDCLGLEQGDVLVAVAVTVDARACAHLHLVGLLERSLVDRSEEDSLDNAHQISPSSRAPATVSSSVARVSYAGSQPSFSRAFSVSMSTGTRAALIHENSAGANGTRAISSAVRSIAKLGTCTEYQPS